ncbi:MAG: AlkA N-terminal domain-containing protein [Acidimicrobiales bacterium]
MDDDHCYRAVLSRDGRFDGAFFTAVTTTGIYCRPSCPATTPKRTNIRFFPTAAAAQDSGFRACKRCQPDAAPGSAEWNGRADVVARAMRLIGDGLVEREGVSGLAHGLGYSPRQLHRLVFAELGAGPLTLARAHRVQHARMLLETTDLAMSEVAWAAGFGSIRQFNDSIRHVYALSPTELRRGSAGRYRRDAPRMRPGGAWMAGGTPPGTANTVTVRLSYRPPLDLPGLLRFLGDRAVPGVENFDGESYRRVIRLPHGLGAFGVTAPAEARQAPTVGRTPGASCQAPGTRRRTPTVPGQLECALYLDDARDFMTAISRVRRLLDLDADPVAVTSTLGGDRLLGPPVRSCPGRRVPGSVDGAETAVRAVLGQQVSVPGARRLAARLAEEHGKLLAAPVFGLTRAFPTAEALAAADPESLPLPGARQRALVGLAAAVADGKVCLDPGADRDEAEARLLELPGIGPWTASYVRMRALGDPDVFLPTDLGVQRALAGLPGADPGSWRPWRSYAVAHLWGSLPSSRRPRP